MGNFSRNTFDPRKGYVGVRLQQGVPLVDADWNELNDVLRQETHDSLRLLLSDGILPGGMYIYGSELPNQNPPIAPNDFIIGDFTAVVGGRISGAISFVRYSQQPWTDSARAARDGVAPIPPLTTPTAQRTDTIYMDVWEREVTSAEDSQIVNPVINIETSVRLKREAAIRVAEDQPRPPTAPAGHRYFPIAQVSRAAGNTAFPTDTFVDLRPTALPWDQRILDVPLIPGPTSSPQFAWDTGAGVLNKFAPRGLAIGSIHLALPDGARVNGLHVEGVLGVATPVPTVLVALRRWHRDVSQQRDGEIEIVQATQIGAGTFQLTALTSNARLNLNRIDTFDFNYELFIQAISTGNATITKIRLDLD